MPSRVILSRLLYANAPPSISIPDVANINIYIYKSVIYVYIYIGNIHTERVGLGFVAFYPRYVSYDAAITRTSIKIQRYIMLSRSIVFVYVLVYPRWYFHPPYPTTPFHLLSVSFVDIHPRFFHIHYDMLTSQLIFISINVTLYFSCRPSRSLNWPI